MYGDYQGMLFHQIDPLSVDIYKLAQISRSVYPRYYPVNAVIPPGGNPSETPTFKIADGRIFWCIGVTGRYTTLSGGADVGTCQLSMKLRDTSKGVDIIPDFITMDLILAPGRVRAAGVAGDPSHQVFYPGFINHIIFPDTTMEVPMASSAAADNNNADLAFFGYEYVVGQGDFSRVTDASIIKRQPAAQY